MGQLKAPPPVRRIVVDKEPTKVAPPRQPRGGRTAANVKSTASDLLSAPRKRAGARGKVTERMSTDGLVVAYNGKQAVNGVSLNVKQGEVLALIGPSGCGKTTLLRSLNRLVDQTPTATTEGTIYLDGQDVAELDVTDLRRQVGMVFQQPNPFPMSIFDNIAYGIRERGSRRPGRASLEPAVIEALERAGLYEEVKDNLMHPALRLSGGQQQRLCIARSLAVKPEVLLLDEPCSALDPRSTAIIEELIMKLRSEIAIVIVTHNLQQAYRVADKVAFMYLGDLVEYGESQQVFGSPKAARTKEYVSGGFG
ncbi:MAG: phosphate ABC transporter ATP-binding protein [Solirubrobacterales bacterium]|nr:phosphate ABC transporter ATP-binding protein [Solirubrobacterales bacterium]